MPVYVEALTEYEGVLPGLFLAGGITGCADWQQDAVKLVAAAPIAVFNPRRADFPIDDPTAAAAQIEWEFRHLRRAAVVLFWFTAGPSLQPITLYELGAQAACGKPIAVGCDPAYGRRLDVRVQLGLARPEVVVRASLAETCADAIGLITPR